MSDAYIDTCGTCCSSGSGCSNPITPSICAANTTYWGCYPAGKYTVSLCGTASWNHYTNSGVSTGDPPSDAWIVTMYGHDDSNVFGGYGQNAIVTLAGAYVLSFVDGGPIVIGGLRATQPPGVGYAYEWQAAQSANGASLVFLHQGGPIGINLMDNSYDNNCGGGNACGATSCGTNPTPSFGLSGTLLPVNYVLVAKTTCGRINTYDGGVTYHYEVDFAFSSVCPYTNASVTLDTANPTNQILSPSTATTFYHPEDATTDGVIRGNNAVNVATLHFDLRDETNKSFTGRLLFSGGTDILGNPNVLNGAHLDYDLTPNIRPSFSAGFLSGACAANSQYLQMCIDMCPPASSGLPCLRENNTCDLSCTVTEATGTVTNYYNNDCSAPPLLVTGGPACPSCCPNGPIGILNMLFTTGPGNANQVTLNFAWKVGTVTLPPTSQCLNLDWLGGSTTTC